MEKIYETKYKGGEVMDIPMRFAKKALKLERRAKIKEGNISSGR